MKALLIPVDGPPREVDLPGGGTRFMRSLKALIGTRCAERIQVTSRWEAWLDEDGATATRTRRNRRLCHQPRPGPSSKRSGHRLPDVGIL